MGYFGSGQWSERYQISEKRGQIKVGREEISDVGEERSD